MESTPCSHLWNTRKRERVRCSSLVDWPVYPRLRTLRRRQLARNAATYNAELGCIPGEKARGSVEGLAEVVAFLEAQIRRKNEKRAGDP
jgi:transposase InsO family protein